MWFWQAFFLFFRQTPLARVLASVEVAEATNQRSRQDKARLKPFGPGRPEIERASAAGGRVLWSTKPAPLLVLACC